MRIITEQPNINTNISHFNTCVGSIYQIIRKDEDDKLYLKLVENSDFFNLNNTTVVSHSQNMYHLWETKKTKKLNFIYKRDEKLNQILSDDSVADVKKNFLSTTPLVPTTIPTTNTQNK